MSFLKKWNEIRVCKSPEEIENVYEFFFSLAGELADVVEAAHMGVSKAKFKGVDERGFLYENTELGDALDALDRKADEL